MKVTYLARQSLPVFRMLVAMMFLFSSARFSYSDDPSDSSKKRVRARDLKIEIGKLEPGKWNAITDVPGVKVGHTTLHEGTDIHTGVTAILPHGGNLFQEKVPAAIVVGNGFGKLAGSTQVKELGNIETPIALTNTLSVAPAISALVRYSLDENDKIKSVNAVVGETNDGRLSDIRGLHITEEHVLTAVRSAESGPVPEGSVGAGSGTQCFGFKGGIGTSSRILKSVDGMAYTLGVLVQTNYGGDLRIDGTPLGDTRPAKLASLNQPNGDGSCMIVIATDAPFSVRNLERIAKRALHGMARTGSSMSNGSGDYVIAFSTAYRIPYRSTGLVEIPPLVGNDHITPFFEAAMNATEEAIYNSLFMATTVQGKNGTAEAIDLELVKKKMRRSDEKSE